MIKKIAKRFLEKRIGLSKYQSFWKSLYLYSLRGMNIGGGSYTSDSGEQWVVEYLRNNIIIDNEQSIIFDVGANIGNYAVMLRDFFKKSSIYSFEPAHDTYDLLVKNTKDSNINTYNFGLSDVASTSTLYYDENTSGMASLYKRQLDWRNVDFSMSEDIQLRTLDEFCEQESIRQIDLLKMDVEGNEYKVLLGAKNLLDEHMIKAIQMEFGGCNIDSRTYFRDFWNLLSGDFQFFRIVSDGIELISEYDETLEIFTCTNFLMINKQIIPDK